LIGIRREAVILLSVDDGECDRRTRRDRLEKRAAEPNSAARFAIARLAVGYSMTGFAAS